MIDTTIPASYRNLCGRIVCYCDGSCFREPQPTYEPFMTIINGDFINTPDYKYAVFNEVYNLWFGEEGVWVLSIDSAKLYDTVKQAVDDNLDTDRPWEVRKIEIVPKEEIVYVREDRGTV